MLVCLSGVGLLPSYENFSLILEKLPPTIGYLTIDFPNTGRSPIHDQAGKNLDNLADAVYKVLEELAISEYILCAHSLSGILACKLLKKPIKCQALVAMEPTTKNVMFADFSENPYPEMEKQMRLIEECGPELYFKNLTQETFSPETNKEIWELMQEKGSELENQDTGFQISGEITEEDFENVSIQSHVPVFIFVSLIEKKSTENQNIGLPILNSF